jgi:sulfonate transport system substrate-binding protein
MSTTLGRRMRPFVIAFAVAVPLAACGSSSTAGAKQTPAAGSSSSAIPAGTVLEFGDQQELFKTLLNSSKALDGAPYEVKFAEFNSGPLVNAGFTANRIDLGFMGDLPASLAVQSGIPVRAIAVAKTVGPAIYLVAKPGITSIADLEGKRVAYTTGTAQQAFALRAFATAGLKQQDVQQVNVSLLQLGTVLDSGAADASVVSIQQKVNYEQHHAGATTLATSDSVKPASYLYVLATNHALADPAKSAALDDLRARLIRAVNWQVDHGPEWIDEYYVGVQHQTPDAAKLILGAGGSYQFVPLGSDVQTALQNVVDLLAGAGALPSRYGVDPLFDAAQTQRYNSILEGVHS